MIEERLEELGIALPVAPAKGGNYKPSYVCFKRNSKQSVRTKFCFQALPVRSFGIRSSTTYSFYPLHNSAEFYLCPAIAFHQKQKCPQHIHHLTLGLNLTTLISQ